MNRAVFLDRDNTLIHNDGDLGDPAQVRLIQGAASAIASLKGLGYKVIVVSNQGGVARGKYTEADVEATNQRINQLIHENSDVTVDRFYYCPYHPQGTVEKYRSEHPWRKPAPGMLLQAASDLDLDLGQCWMIGDQMRDIQAGHAAGVRTVLLNPQAANQPPLLQEAAAAQLLGKSEVMPDFVARNIIEAVRVVAQQRRPEGADELRTMTDATLRSTGIASPGADGAGNMVVKPVQPIPPEPVHTAQVMTLPSLSASIPGATPPKPVAKPPAPYAEPVAPVRPVDMPAQAGSITMPEPDATSIPADPAKSGDASSVNQPDLVSTPSVEQSLRQILQELRNHRRVGQELSYVGVMAIVLQMLAAVCLVGGLLIGRADAEVYYRWLGCGLMFQLATIAMLLFRR